MSPQVDGRKEDASLSHSASVSSLVKRGSREDEPQPVKTVSPCTVLRVFRLEKSAFRYDSVPSGPHVKVRFSFIIQLLRSCLDACIHFDIHP